LKFSVLLPTRNRLEYLKLAVESVLRQDVVDWQLVVSDNCSEQDIEGYLSSLRDTRIVYRRTERVVAVTENWNRALAHSEGDYVIMLGDDDALLGGYMRRMDELTREFEDPDVIYTKALLFTYPGVDPDHPAGFVMDHGCAEFFPGAAQPFVLERSRALELVRAAMRFRLRYDFNAQFALFNRRLIDSLLAYGDFYQSAFPDYYSMNAAFLRAGRIVVEPSARVVIGVTPKSYGYFHVNRREAEGRAFLDGAGASSAVGTNINVGWLSAATALEQGVGADFGLRVDRRRYRFVQAAHVYERYRAGAIGNEEVRRLERELPLLERWAYRGASGALGLVHRLLPQRLKVAMVSIGHRLVGQLPVIVPTIVEGRYRDILEVCKDRSDGAAAPVGGN
jgi:glycosyltransferase involved in cell wall biosynthesis